MLMNLMTNANVCLHNVIRQRSGQGYLTQYSYEPTASNLTDHWYLNSILQVIFVLFSMFDDDCHIDDNAEGTFTITFLYS